MCSSDLIRPAAAANHREVVAPWWHPPVTRLHGYGVVFLDEFESYTGSATRGTHRGGLRVVAGSGAVRSTARFFSRSSAISTRSSKGWHKPGLVQTGAAELVDRQGGVGLAWGGLWWRGDGERRS
jgi:hypothetical protein